MIKKMIQRDLKERRRKLSTDQEDDLKRLVSRQHSRALHNFSGHILFISWMIGLFFSLFDFSHFHQQNQSNTNGCIRIGKMDHIILVKCKPDLSQTEIDSQFKGSIASWRPVCLCRCIF